MEELKIVAKISKCTYGELNPVEKKLVDAAKEAAGLAYAPYSGFRVGAAALLEGDIIVTGNNQENAAYPSGLCAERVAVFSAGATHPGRRLLAVAVAACYGGKFTDHAPAPCGACRQVLLESELRYGHPVRLVLYGEREVCVVEKASDLLPLAFRLEG